MNVDDDPFYDDDEDHVYDAEEVPRDDYGDGFQDRYAADLDEEDNFYSQSPAQRRAKSSGSTTRWLIIGLGGGAVVCLFACCIGVSIFGLKLVTADVKERLEDHAVVQEHIGNISSFEMNFVDSVSNEDDETWVYTIKGDQGEGTVTLNHVTDVTGEEVIRWGRLTLSSGESFDLEFEDELVSEVFDEGEFGQLLADEVRGLVKDDVVLREHVGEIQSFTIDWEASGEHPDEDTWIYDVEGDRGKGKLTLQHITNDDGDEVVQSGALKMSTGETYELNY